MMNRISIIPLKKFKDVVVTLRFASENQNNKTQRSLLALMLSDRSQKYDSKVKMNKKLDNMFGATLTSSVHNYGQAHVLDLSLGVLNEKFVKSDLFQDQIELLHELLYRPLLNENVFLEAKQVLKDMILREIDNLQSYANKQALKIAGQDYPLAYDRLGNLEALDKIDLKDVLKEMDSLLLNDVLNIIVVGDVNKEKTENLLNKHFTDNFKNTDFKSNYLIKSSKIKQIEESRDINQAYLTIVYNTHTKNTGKDYWALQLMSMILGGLPNSFLFQEVREKRSLCYTIRSTIRGYEGIMTIDAGVRLDSIDQAVDISIAQVDRLLKGDFTDELFISAKKMLIDSMYKTDDSNRRMIVSHYRNIILKENFTTLDLIEIVSKINRSDIVRLAKKLELNTIYKLVRGKDHA